MNIEEIKQKTTPIFKQFGVHRAAVFGSVARGQDKKESDDDLIVKFGQPMGMFKYMQFIDSLESSLDKKVDVVTEKSLNKSVKPYILPEIKMIYEKWVSLSGTDYRIYRQD